MIVCSHCDEPLTSIRLERNTSAEIYYEDIAFITLEHRDGNIVVTRSEVTPNSDESVGDTLDQFTVAKCGHCDHILDLDGQESLMAVIENVFEDG